MEILIFGGGERQGECGRLLSESLATRSGRLLLLPIPTSRDNKFISGTEIPLSDITPMLCSATALVGYGIPDTVRDAALKNDVAIYDAALDENFLLKNAYLTAMGTLGYMLTHGGRDLYEMNVGVVGYGRIGVRLVRLLLQVGARVTLFTTRRSVAIELGEMGVAARLLPTADYSGIDLLVNTSPARLVNQHKIDPWVKIIDLASGGAVEPDGRVVRLPSVPEMYYPITAGRYYAEGALSALWGIGL